MSGLLTAALASAALLVLLPSLVFFVECVVASLFPLAAEAGEGMRGSVAVLVPAHDEEPVIGTTVARLVTQLRPGDRLVVVADNCTDGTATAARAAGATVVERRDPERRGKGFALEHGVEFLADSPPDVVVVVDADCTLAPGSIEALAVRVRGSGRPAQARNLVLPGEDPRPLDSVAAFAFLVKNVVRPSGLARLGLPCGLMGTGMAFPWAILRGAALGTSALVEDMQLGVDLLLAGHAPLFCPTALVTSPSPGQAQARASQRRRWEHGHLATVGSAPRMLTAGARRFDPAILAMAADLCVPPLSLLVLVTAAVLAASAAAAALGLAAWLPALVAGTALALVLVGVAAAWLRFARGEYPASVLMTAPFYSLAKVPLYLGFLGRRQKTWVRTAREPRSEMPADPEVPVVDFGPLRVHAVTMDEAVDLVARRAASGRGGFVLTPNVDHLASALRDPEFSSAYERVFLSLADGMPLVLTSRLLGLPVRDRVAGSDLLVPLMARCASDRLPVFFLGATEETCREASRRLRADHPGIEIAGFDTSRFDHGKDPEGARKALRCARDLGARMILVCLPTAKTLMLSRFEDDYRPAVGIGVGASLAFYVGEVRRAPAWMARTGLEWLHRLAQEPSRLWRRYLVDNPRALPVFLGMALSRARGRPLHRRCRVETSPLRAEPFPPAAITHASRVPSPSVASTRRARVT